MTFNNIYFLIWYFQNISIYDQYKNHYYSILHSLLNMKSKNSGMYCTFTAHNPSDQQLTKQFTKCSVAMCG